MRPRRVRPIACFVLALAMAALSGCCTSVLCDRCQPSGLYLKVSDAWTQMVLTDVTVSVKGQPCALLTSNEQLVFLCALAAGEHTIDLEAANYSPQQVTVTLKEESAESCCPCGPIGYGTAELTPLESM